MIWADICIPSFFSFASPFLKIFLAVGAEKKLVYYQYRILRVEKNMSLSEALDVVAPTIKKKKGYWKIKNK